MFWICLGLVVAFFVGRHTERTTTIQNNVDGLNTRVKQLEMRNLRQDERWGWFAKIGARIPLIKHFC